MNRSSRDPDISIYSRAREKFSLDFLKFRVLFLPVTWKIIIMTISMRKDIEFQKHFWISGSLRRIKDCSLARNRDPFFSPTFFLIKISYILITAHFCKKASRRSKIRREKKFNFPGEINKVGRWITRKSENDKLRYGEGKRIGNVITYSVRAIWLFHI